MSQYERIVSYLYQYRQGEKGANAGYAKVERRGELCRIAVQMRAVSVKAMPKVYLYQQREDGIQTVYAGQMLARGGNLFFKVSTNAGQLFGSEKGLGDIDGIFIHTEDVIYFATSWRQDSFFLGNWGKDVEYREKSAASAVKELSGGKEVPIEKIPVETAPEALLNQVPVETAPEASLNQVPVETVPEASLNQVPEGNGSDEQKKPLPEEEIGAAQSDMQMQSVCGMCPFQRQRSDYGQKMLMTFPSMKPFQEGVAKACVRMELQDIGCLPIALWSLSGNRFLLHGYYCYRHLVFAQMADERYVLGVPGIYSEKEQKNARRFGFTDFQALGDLEIRQGAFGYWLLELPREPQPSFAR